MACPHVSGIVAACMAAGGACHGLPVPTVIAKIQSIAEALQGVNGWARDPVCSPAPADGKYYGHMVSAGPELHASYWESSPSPSTSSPPPPPSPSLPPLAPASPPSPPAPPAAQLPTPLIHLDAASLPSSSTSVTTLPDLTGNGYDAAASSSAAVSTDASGRRAVQFSGNYLQISKAISLNLRNVANQLHNGFTIMAVAVMRGPFYGWKRFVDFQGVNCGTTACDVIFGGPHPDMKYWAMHVSKPYPWGTPPISAGNAALPDTSQPHIFSVRLKLGTPFNDNTSRAELYMDARNLSSIGAVDFGVSPSEEYQLQVRV